MKNECDVMTESDFRKWLIRNFCKLKEYALTQCKETKDFERGFDKMLTRIENLERNISELMDLKNTTRELKGPKLKNGERLTKQMESKEKKELQFSSTIK